MTLYARIQDGQVAELFTPQDGFLITDCFPPDYAELFIAVPDGVFPEEGWTATQTGDVWTYAAPPPYVPPPLTWDQELATRIAAGIVITSAATPALNATYGLDAGTMGQIGPVARDYLVADVSLGAAVVASGAALSGWVRSQHLADFLNQRVEFNGLHQRHPVLGLGLVCRIRIGGHVNDR